MHTDPTGKITYEATIGISWTVIDTAIPLPRNSPALIAEMKQRATGFAEPMLSMINNLSDDNTTAIGLRLADFPPVSWDSRNGTVTMAGDAAHTMTMYRGEGANHGILDAALLTDQIKRFYAGEVGQAEGVRLYEEEMRERTYKAVLMSRQAALDGHDWAKIDVTSPLIGMRVPPAIVQS